MAVGVQHLSGCGCSTLGAFSHSASYYGVYPGNSPKNLPPLEACMGNSELRN